MILYTYVVFGVSVRVFMTQKFQNEQPMVDGDALVSSLASALGLTLPDAKRIQDGIVDAACAPFSESTQRLVKLSDALDKQFKEIADDAGVGASALMRSVMFESIVSGRAKLISTQIKPYGVRAKSNQSRSNRNPTTK